jgi:hypothetical protein
MWWTCSGGDAAGVTAGGACTVAVVDGVVIAGATAGATGTAAGNLNFLPREPQWAEVRFGLIADIMSFALSGSLARTPIDTMTPSAVRLGDLVYQVGEAATELRIKNVFDAFNAFVMRRRIKLLS